jgi:hypothetical protein
MTKNKRAAMEMTVGTIVTIVLLMSALVLGLILTYRIFFVAHGAIGLTEQELNKQLSKAFGQDEDTKLSLYPSSADLTVKQEKEDAIGLGIRNLLTGVSGTQKFSYNVTVASTDGCGNTNVLDWIGLGKSESNININVGDYYSTKIYIEIPSGAPLCDVNYRVEVKTGGPTGMLNTYDNIVFKVTSKSK